MYKTLALRYMKLIGLASSQKVLSSLQFAHFWSNWTLFFANWVFYTKFRNLFFIYKTIAFRYMKIISKLRLRPDFHNQKQNNNKNINNMRLGLGVRNRQIV